MTKIIAAELYSAAQVRELDRRAIEDCGIPGYTLMQRAAAAAWAAARDRWPAARRIAVVCGSGNNGGDGYEIACLARTDGCLVQVFEIDDLPRRNDALTARQHWLVQGGDVQRLACHSLEAAEIIVDALFGTGLSRPPEAAAQVAIETINAAHAGGAGVLALDLPSGLMADTGTVPGAAVDADLTVSFIGRKLGLHTAQGPAHSGVIVFADLDVPRSVFVGLSPPATLIDAGERRGWLPPRQRTAHKGDHGHVLLVGGDHGMAGAILIAARAALRAGAGLVSVATRAAHAAALAAAQPEIMFHVVEEGPALKRLIEGADVLAIGPGLGQERWGRQMFERAMTSKLPMVVDADALNLLAVAEPRHRDDWVLTPHPGEAGRLLGLATAAVQANRISAAAALRQRFGGISVLKGAGSLVQGEQLRVCSYGNPGMAVGGMGDALTGIVAAFIAQGLPLEAATAAAVTVHALAGDLAATRGGERGLAASDLIAALREVVNP